MKHNCGLTATCWGELLRANIPDRRWQIEARYPGGNLALTLDCLQARLLASRNMVRGLVIGGSLRYLTITQPKAAIVRLLRMDPARPGEITRGNNANSLHYSLYERIGKLGRVGSCRTMHANVFRRVSAPLPGTAVQIERRIVA